MHPLLQQKRILARQDHTNLTIRRTLILVANERKWALAMLVHL